MKKVYNILNGDALKEQVEGILQEPIIIARLCLVDGDVKATSLPEFFEIRAKFIYDIYNVSDPKAYYKKVAPEIKKILTIGDGSEVNLWFEDDLFCQVNFWFIMSLLENIKKKLSVFLVRPKEGSKYSFGHMTQDELKKARASKIAIGQMELEEIAKLWPLYQEDDCESMLEIADQLKIKYPFIKQAIEAHKDRLPIGNDATRPIKATIQIMKDLDTKEFGAVFQEFTLREGIYGFGDLQFKRLFNQVIEGDLI